MRWRRAGKGSRNVSTTAIVAAFRRHGPVNQERPPHDGITINKSPVAAVLTVLAVVTHGAILSGGDDNLVTLNILADPMAPFRNGVERNHLGSNGHERLIKRIVRCRPIM